MIHVVTNGAYSDYKICGVFDDEVKAEKFREYHAFDKVEKHEMNPTHPAYDLLQFQCIWYEKQDKVYICRVGNDPSDCVNDKDVEINARNQSAIQENPVALQCVIWAHTEEQAKQGCRDRIRSVKAGLILPVFTRNECKYEVSTLDPRERPKRVLRYFTHHYLYNPLTGKFDCVNTEEEEIKEA
jgi:hypothetical protein